MLSTVDLVYTHMLAKIIVTAEILAATRVRAFVRYEQDETQDGKQNDSDSRFSCV